MNFQKFPSFETTFFLLKSNTEFASSGKKEKFFQKALDNFNALMYHKLKLKKLQTKDEE